MGAYENPETAIDTQSGQHWRNLQQTITSAGQAVTNTIIAREKEKRDEEKEKKKEDDKKLQKDTDEKKAMLLNGVGKYDDNVSVMKQKNPGVDMSGLYDGGNYYADLNSKVNDPDTNPFQLKQGMVKAGNVIDQFKGFVGWTSSEYEGFLKMQAKGFQAQGGISIANTKARIAQTINVLTKTPSYGTKFKPNDGTPSLAITFNKNSFPMPDGSAPPEIDLFTFGDMLKEDGSFLRGVPEVDDLINNSLNNQALASILGMEKDDQGNMKFNGKILNEKYIEEVAVPGKQVKGAKNAVIGVTDYMIKIKKEELGKDPAIENHIDTVAAGILGGSKWGATDLYLNQLVPLWNATHSKEKQIVIPTDEKELSEFKVDPEQFKEKFLPFYLNHIQDYVATDANGKPKQTMEVIKGGDSSGGGNVTQAKRNYALARIAAVQAQGSGKIVGTKGFVKFENGKYTMYKWKNANNTLMEKGNFYSIDATPDTTPEDMYDLMGVYSVPVGVVKPALEVKK
jgi:uncharacterized short protein YbdD (DUF466 family)